MTIDEEINEYPELSCTYENQSMHIEILEWEQICTWMTSHNKLIEVNAQLRNNFEHEYQKNITQNKNN